MEADVVVLGPGDLYTSLVANLAVSGVSTTIKESKAGVVYVVNLINKYGQTHGFKAKDYVNEIYKYLKFYPSYVLINETPLPKRILKKYKKEKGFPVKNNLVKNPHYKIIGKDLLAGRTIKRQSGDEVKRSLIRHDSDKLAKELVEII